MRYRVTDAYLDRLIAISDSLQQENVSITMTPENARFSSKLNQLLGCINALKDMGSDVLEKGDG